MPEVTFEVTPIICPEYGIHLLPINLNFVSHRINGQQCNGLQIEQEALFNITATLAQCSNTPLEYGHMMLFIKVLVPLVLVLECLDLVPLMSEWNQFVIANV